MSDSIVEADFSVLEKLAKELGKDFYVDVGYIGGETSERGETIAEIMARHEFGVPEEHLPRRSQILDPILFGQKDIEKSIDKSKDELLASGDVKGIFKKIGVACEAEIQKAFDTSLNGSWAPLSENYKIRPSGKEVDESSKPLIDTGISRKAVSSKVGER